MADQTVHGQFSVSGVQIGLTRKPLSPWGGLSLFAAFGEAIGLRHALDMGLAGLQRSSPNALPASDLLLGFMVGVLTGATRFLHLERLRGDAVLRSVFGLSRFVSPTTYTRFFMSLPGQVREDLWAFLLRWNLAMLPEREEGYTLDIDSTVVERFGEQEGARLGYNPRRRGGPTHHPLLAGLAEPRLFLHAWLRGGNTASGQNAVPFLEECLALAEGRVKLRLLRADNGFFDNRILTALEQRGLPYIVKARFTKLVQRAVQQASEWVSLGSGIEVAEARVQLLRWDRQRRLVLIRHRVPERRNPQGRKLFESEGHRYQAIVTSFTPQELDAAAVYRGYLPRGEFENRIKEVKRGCGLEGFCMDDFHGTETVLRVLCLVHNLVQQFQDAIGLRPAHRPKEEGPRHTLETLRTRLFTCAAVLGRRGRSLVLRIAASPPWWDRFQRALARLLPAQPNCRAAPNSPLQPPLQFE